MMKIYEIYTDKGGLVQLTMNNEHCRILDEHPDWVAKEIDIVEALVKYANIAIQASRDVISMERSFR